MTTGTDSTGSGPLTTEQILREEAAAIHGEDKVRAATGANLNHTLNNLDSAALCLSGGGIRSAAFGLGVLQALALHPRAEGKGTAANSLESSLLAKFHYLSTVSGGGYIGSWLSAFRKRSDFPTVWRALTGRPSGPNVEPPPLAWLRSYSNYITAKLGLTSADTWTAVAQYVGNLLLNWLIILPVVCIPILVLKILAVLLDAVMLVRNWNPRHLFAVEDVCTINWQPYALFAVGGAACLIVALGFLTHSRPSRQLEDTKAERIGVDQTAFIWGFLIWSVLAAVALSQVVGSDPIGKLFVKLGSACNAISQDATGLLRPLFPLWQFLAAGALVGFVVYAAGWIVGWPRKRDVRDFALWSASGVVYGALVALGFYLYLIIPGADEKQAELAKFTDSPAMYLTFWAPWMLCSQVIALTIFVGLISYQKRFDADREWISRAAGWIIVAAIGWLVMTFLVFAGLLTLLQSGFAAKIGVFVGTYLVPIGALAGLVTALAGWSSVTKTKPGSKDVSSRAADYLLAVSAPLFVAGLISALSIALDKLLLGKMLFQDYSMMKIMPLTTMDPRGTFANVWNNTLLWLLLGLGVSCLAGFVASRRININRFSLHAFYRNRLIRAFLGASRLRQPDAFTGLDEADNPRMHTLWPPKAGSGWQPFHVVNVTLNVVSSKRLAWQERKAAPFTVSPLHSGTGSRSVSRPTPIGAEAIPVGAYRPSLEYGGRGTKPSQSGITLGTAMAISGAAASPNMGYHSSPAMTLLMAMFNVRLGWWLGNPGPEGEQTYFRDGPQTAVVPLLQETFGLTTDDSKYIYLSDGGHFENLGLYEMVRRRCRCILVSDAGCDPNYGFEDVGNALRKIAIDLGVPITFKKLESLSKRQKKNRDPETYHPYCAVGEIDYSAADGHGENGYILYVKPGYHGTENAGIRAYAIANPIFPHEATSDQFFSESQFESYRSLGFEIVNDVLARAFPHVTPPEDRSLKAIFGAIGRLEIPAATRPRSPSARSPG